MKSPLLFGPLVYGGNGGGAKIQKSGTSHAPTLPPGFHVARTGIWARARRGANPSAATQAAQSARLPRRRRTRMLSALLPRREHAPRRPSRGVTDS